MTDITEEEIESTFQRLTADAKRSGYNLNPDEEFTKELVESLLINGKRYGYWACPCRLADEVKEEDLDLICPCDYRDVDVEEFGACYCALYVDKEIASGEKEAKPIPDRRPEREERAQFKASSGKGVVQTELAYPVWRCRVCGYLCAREEPPGICPVCKAGKERFDRFM